ncbi:glycosyltransferase [Bacillus carboniphilus]|uniref:Glycosyltransferase n=1 Tax=Bacillus carboniphilus TaxID=86663 RepID=A0ABY9JWB0_9BACI|nr:glycosyltransferase [Bacillus carboniphilus]WLR42793.1 glycosyltransferase [Bacillus carboniphilus]
MKKKLLFVMNNMQCGGAERALLSLLESIDESQFEIDLYLLRNEGDFLRKIPSYVNVLGGSNDYKYFNMSFANSMKHIVFLKKYKAFIARVMLGFYSKTHHNSALVEQKVWKFLSKIFEPLENEYDVAIGFLEKNPIYFCVDHVNARKKIGWIHTDYNQLGLDVETDEKYYSKLSYLISVSDELVNILKSNFPSMKSNIKCIENIVSTNIIKKLSQEPVTIERNSQQSIIIVSVGRIVQEKGIDLSFKAIHQLIDKGYDIQWIVIGDGVMREEIEKQIELNHLSKRMKFLGVKDNPYPYMAQADIFLQTSRYEGKSISIMEAKILGTPILITNFDTANDHIQHDEDGYIANMDETSIVNGLEYLIKNEKVREKYIANLMEQNYGTEDEVEKLYELVGE